MIKKINLKFSNKDIKKIYKKVENFPWKDVFDNKNWVLGTNLAFMKKISKYWIHKFK